MLHKNKKNKKGSWQPIFFSVLTGVALFVIVGFLIYSNLRINQRRAELLAKIEPLKQEIQMLEEKNRKLRSGIVDTEEDVYWEEKVREQGYKKPEEEAVVILPPEENGEELVEEEKSFWQKLVEKLGF